MSDENVNPQQPAANTLKAKPQVRSNGKGGWEQKNGENWEAFEAPKPAASAAAAEVSHKWTGRIRKHAGGELKFEGIPGAAKQTWAEVRHGLTPGNGAKLGERGMAFGRIGTVGAGAYIASGALQSKNADGTDRGALHRLGNLLVGGGMIAGGVLAGRA